MATKSLSSVIPFKHVLITGPPGVGKTTLVRNVCDLLQERHGVIVRGFYTEEVRVAGGGGGGARGRGRGPRIGFDVVTLDGKRAPLARADSDSVASGPQPAATRKCPYVGKYRVDVHSFETLALPTLDLSTPDLKPPQTGRGVATEGATSCDEPVHKSVLVIDEIGKMELFSPDFVKRIDYLFKETSHTHTPSQDGRGHVGVVILATIPVQRPQQKAHWLLGQIRQRRDCKLYEVTENNRDQLVQEITSFVLEIT